MVTNFSFFLKVLNSDIVILNEKNQITFLISLMIQKRLKPVKSNDFVVLVHLDSEANKIYYILYAIFLVK